MFFVAKRSRPIFAKRELVEIVEQDRKLYLYITGYEWVKQEGSAHFDWFYRGITLSIVDGRLQVFSISSSWKESRLERLEGWKAHM
jgi:hypothetical protein